MDEETIKRINRDALRAAQESMGGGGAGGQNQMMMYIVAVVAAVIAYFLLQAYQPNFVMVTVNGQAQFDQTRAIIASVVIGLLVILCYNLCQ